jgi:hypothetical protein
LLSSQPHEEELAAIKIRMGPAAALDRKSPDSAQATPSPGSSEASITQAATEYDPQDLPELTSSEQMSPPDTDELHSMDGLYLRENVPQKELHRELEWLEDLPETNSDKHESPLFGEDALFSQYLRSRSPSCLSAQGMGGNNDSDGGMYSQTVTLMMFASAPRRTPI